MGFCSMIMQMFDKNSKFVFVKKIFEMHPTQNVWCYLPQRHQKTSSGI